jgi:hypothetical protein
MVDIIELQFQIGDLTCDFITDVIVAKGYSLAKAEKYSNLLYETALNYYAKYGEESLTNSIEINCLLCGTNLADLNSYIYKHTGRADYYKKKL